MITANTTELLSIGLEYWILAISVMLIGLAFGFWHKKPITMVWGAVTGGMIMLFAPYFAPAVYGYWIHGNSLIGVISLLFIITMIFFLIMVLFNIVRWGTLWDTRKTDIAKEALMAILVVAVLFMPIGAAYYSETTKTNTILTADSADLYELGYVNSAPLDYLDVYDGLSVSPNNIYNESSPDTFIYAYNNPAQYESATFNSVISVNNTNTVSGLNYSVLSYDIDSVSFALSKNTSDLSQHDYLLLNSTDKHGSVALVIRASLGNGSTIIYFDETDTGEYLIVLDTATKATLDAALTDTVYLVYFGIDETDTSWSWKLSYNEISDAIWSWDDYQLYSLSLVVGLIANCLGIMFASDTYDIVVDRTKKRVRRP